MEISRDHYHPLNSSTICCADHASELITIYTQQNRAYEILSVLLNFSEILETRFLLNNSETTIQIKLKLGKMYNKQAMVNGLELPVMKVLLETAHVIYSSLPSQDEYLGLLATASSNLAFIARTEGQFERACKYLDQAGAIEKKMRDLTGDIMTRINKSSILNELEAHNEAYFTIKEAVTILEEKIQTMLKENTELELKNSKKFIETLQLLIISHLNEVNSLEGINEESKQSEAKKVRKKAGDLCSRFLGDKHHLTQYFPRDPLKSKRSLSSAASDFSINTKRSTVKKSELNKIAIKQAVPEKRPVEKQVSIRSVSVASLKKQPPVNHGEFLEPEKQKAETPAKHKPAEKDTKSVTNETIIIINPDPQESSQYIRRRFSKSTFGRSRSNSSRGSYNQSLSPEKNQNQKPQEPKLKIIRMPWTSLPWIPTRPSFLRYFQFTFTITPPRSYAYLLDPSKSTISSQVNTSINTIQIVNNEKRILTFCIQGESPSKILKIVASSERTQVLELIKLPDLQSILKHFCVLDVLPSYLQPGFVYDFEGFCRYYLAPFVKILPVEGSNSEIIELWARGESLLPQTVQTFLNTECSVLLFYVEKHILRMVIASMEQEDSNDKCLRVDIILDEVMAESVMKPHVLSESEQKLKYLQSIEPISYKFAQDLDPIISEIELCIKDMFTSSLPDFEQFIVNNNSISFRAIMHGQHSETYLWTLQDCRKARCWIIRVKLLHKANSSGRREKVYTEFNYSYSQIYLTFGVKLGKLDEADISVLKYLVLESMKIEAFSEKKTDEINNEEAIFTSPVRAIRSFRYFIGNKYRTPVTLSIVGVNSFLIGIKASLFNIENCSESSCWLIMDESFYVSDGKDQKSGKYNKGPLRSRLNETRLVTILDEEYGWNKIISALVIEGNEIYIKAKERKSLFESLEIVLNLSK